MDPLHILPKLNGLLFLQTVYLKELRKSITEFFSLECLRDSCRRFNVLLIKSIQKVVYSS